MKDVKIKVIREGNVELPKYMTTGAAGADVHAHVKEPVILKPMERTLISTGMKFEIPEGYEVQLRPRSGFALRDGVTLLNTPGTIDSDYRGEVKVLIINLGDRDVVINPNDRIAQIVVKEAIQAKFEDCEILTTTTRSGGGFGHTGC